MKEKSIQFHNAVTLGCYACGKITNLMMNNRASCPEHIHQAPARKPVNAHSSIGKLNGANPVEPDQYKIEKEEKNLAEKI